MEEAAVVGVDPNRSILWCQVRKGQPMMGVDGDGRLRHINWPGKQFSVFVGDVTDALLRCVGAHEPPSMKDAQGFDNQHWHMTVADTVLKIEIHSQRYWGLGFFNVCYLNKIVIDGPLERRARLAFDLVATLGRNPWEPFLGFMWRRITKASEEEHRLAWDELLSYAKEEMSEQIASYSHKIDELEDRFDGFEEGDFEKWEREEATKNTDLARSHLEAAKEALHDQNAAGVERAIARAEAALIEADPTTEVSRTPFQEADDLLLEESLEVEDEFLKEKVLVHEQLPEDVDTVEVMPHTEETGSVSAEDLLDSEEQDVDNMPFVDLTNSEEE